MPGKKRPLPFSLWGMRGFCLLLALLGISAPWECRTAFGEDADAQAGSALLLEQSATAQLQTAPAFDSSASYAFWLNGSDGRRESLAEYSQGSLAYVTETLRLFRDALPEDGTVHYINVPVASTAERLARRDRYTGWESNMETGLQALVGPGVLIYNVPEILEGHLLAGEQVYMTIDHHWTPLGAYYVCAEMLAKQGLPVLPYNEYAYTGVKSAPSPGRSVDTLALLTPLQPVRSLVVTKRTKEKEIQWMDENAKNYRAYLSGTRLPWRRIVTGFHSGRNVLVVCDSFGNAFTPYLLPYYDEVHMTDPRAKHYSKAQAGGSISELIEYYHIDDVYIVLCAYNGVNMRTSNQNLRNHLLP